MHCNPTWKRSRVVFFLILSRVFALCMHYIKFLFYGQRSTSSNIKRHPKKTPPNGNVASPFSRGSPDPENWIKSRVRPKHGWDQWLASYFFFALVFMFIAASIFMKYTLVSQLSWYCLVSVCHWHFPANQSFMTLSQFPEGNVGFSTRFILRSAFIILRSPLLRNC